jgi:hypothetical protein
MGQESVACFSYEFTAGFTQSTGLTLKFARYLQINFPIFKRPPRVEVEEVTASRGWQVITNRDKPLRREWKTPDCPKSVRHM